MKKTIVSVFAFLTMVFGLNVANLNAAIPVHDPNNNPGITEQLKTIISTYTPGDKVLLTLPTKVVATGKYKLSDVEAVQLIKGGNLKQLPFPVTIFWFPCMGAQILGGAAGAGVSGGLLGLIGGGVGAIPGALIGAAGGAVGGAVTGALTCF